MGGCAMTAHLAPHFGRVLASDLHQDLPLLFAALRDGWQPPEAVSLEEYKSLRHVAPSALRCFAGYACSFGGKWFGGYAKDNPAQGRYYAGAGARGLAKAMTLARGFRNVEFRHGAYQDVPVPPGAVLYCDPPYRGTTPPGEGWPFDSTEFWAWAGRQRAREVRVYVSEEAAPPGWRLVAEVTPHQVAMRRGGKAPLVERLFA